MKVSDNLLQLRHRQTMSYYEDSSFTLVSTLLTEALGQNCQKIVVSAKTGNFLHDHTAEVESTDTTHFYIMSSNVIEREESTEISIDGSVNRKNGKSNNFSIYFTMKRRFLVIPNPANTLESAIHRGLTPRLFGINGMLYNSIFSLNINCIDKSDHQYPLGEGRGYLIFDETQKL